MTGAGADPGCLARWVLLACTLLGLTAMHSLGHHGIHEPHTHSTGVHAGSAGMRQLPIEGAVWPYADGCADDGCAHLGSPVDGGGMPGWAVCVAILGGFAVLLLLAALLRGAARRRHARAERVVGSGASRDPPIQRRGLVLAEVSVLRI